jgi:hypothetical protein
MTGHRWRGTINLLGHRWSIWSREPRPLHWHYPIMLAMPVLVTLAALWWYHSDDPSAAEQAAAIYETDWSKTPLAEIMAGRETASLRIVRLEVPSIYLSGGAIPMQIEVAGQRTRVMLEAREGAEILTVARPHRAVGYVVSASPALLSGTWTVEACIVMEAVE